MSQTEAALEDDTPQQEVVLNTAAPPPEDAEPQPEDECDISTTLSAPKRKRRRRKWGNTEPDFENGCSVRKDEPFMLIHQPFHRIVFDEDGNASDVVLRPQCEYQVNRKHQKRLATSSYKWSSSVQANANIVSVVSTEPKTANLPSAVGHPEVKNLEVRIHRFPNDYETVVNYWYTTLEWLDRATMEDINQEANEDEEGAKEEFGDEESHSDKTIKDEYDEKTLENIVKVEYSLPDDAVNTNAVVNREEAKGGNETIAERSGNAG
ncbi:hypothetical protein TcWFU_008108 [Taenia crassiceps]|uniref:Uncharacterized protein n=1 Tax=Taenia crassiceps TaxID=6207 RepID=A0ABR4Q9L8_9CEST